MSFAKYCRCLRDQSPTAQRLLERCPSSPNTHLRLCAARTTRHVIFRQQCPSWATDPSAAARMINARSETAATKPAFRDALKSRRCLIPADGSYEWMRTGKMKQPYCFEVNEGELFAFAGLWDRWKDSSGKVLGNLFDPDHRPKCRDLSRPRPDASHP